MKLQEQQTEEKQLPIIGTLGEFALHRMLKLHFMSDPQFHEQPVGPYVADIRCGNEIVEIQSRDFYKLKPKLDYYLEHGFRVTVVYPIITEKWLIWTDPETGEMVERKKSPKKGKLTDIFLELRKVLPYVGREDVVFIAVLTKAEELRVLNKSEKNRKRRARHQERIPLEILDEYHLRLPEDYPAILPPKKILPAAFTVKEYMQAYGMSRQTAYAVLRVLRHLGIVEHIGNRGREHEFKLLSPPNGK